MKYCPITYEVIPSDQNYSSRGLHLLSPTLKNLKPLAFNAAEQRQEAIMRAGKMSIQGVQPKLSAQLKIREEYFEIVDQKGTYILKTQSEYYPQLPENEALTMSLAEVIHIEVPVHGLVYAKEDSMTYFIKRFDRASRNKKIAVEDFAQLAGMNRETKYNSSMEQVVTIIHNFCSFPKIEFVKLFKLTLFNFLIGNEDMHLKNFSLITRGHLTSLSPAYDLVNTTIIQNNSKEQIALPLNGKKNNLRISDFIKYFAIERLELNNKIIDDVTFEIKTALPTWKKLIERSYLTDKLKDKYLLLIEARWRALGWE